jgi:cation diffusion facilitator family transporter
MWRAVRTYAHVHTHHHGDQAHDHGHSSGGVLETSRQGLRAVWVSVVALGLTAALQSVVVVWTGSVALLSDTLHNAADALTAVPLGVAFVVGRRQATRRYTYGFGRAEDLAGLAIVLVIAASAVLAGWQVVERLLHPQQVSAIPTVALAGLIGFAGNELVARYRIKVGRRIGSAALVADGLHARADGFTSLAVLAAAGGSALGWTWVDPVVGLFITVAILFVLRDAGRQVYHRLMDAVDPRLLDVAERTLREMPDVQSVGEVRLRWIGHRLRAEVEIALQPELSLAEAHAIAVAAEHRLLHAVPRLETAIVHTDPHAVDGTDHHAPLAHHRHVVTRAGER